MNQPVFTPTPPVSSSSTETPAYDAELSRYHRAFRAELQSAVMQTRVPVGARVLDVPCGDGFYTRLLAEQVGSQGHVIGADALPAYLQRGERAAQAADVAEQTDFVQGDAYRLPFEDQSFDVVWCAQSFISLDAPWAALREFHRVLRAGGCMAVLESDDFHHVVLPWPPALELHLQAALQDACRQEYGDASKTYVSRRMRRWLCDAGFDPVRRASYTADRQQPLPSDTRSYLEVHLAELVKFLRPHLPTPDQEALDDLTRPDSSQYLLDQQDFDMTCLFTVWRGQRND